MLLLLFLCRTHRETSQIPMSCFFSATKEGESEINSQINPEVDQEQCDFPASRAK